MPTIQQLNQTHKTLNVKKCQTLRALYEGDEAFEALLDQFLRQRPSEPNARYELRKSESVYRNYIGPIIDFFTSLLFSERTEPVAKKRGKDDPETNLPDYYANLQKDCDRTGQDLDSAFNWLLTEAMQVKRAWIRLHHPESAAEVATTATQADFEKQKLGDSWLELIPTERVLDWGCDAAGNLSWAITYKSSIERRGIASSTSHEIHTWEYLTPELVETYQIEYESDKKPADDTSVPLINTIRHRYKAVPLVCLDLKPKLWVASRLESPQKAHFRLSNAQTWGLAATCYAMPVVKVKNPDEFTKRTMGAGYGFTIQPDEDVGWTAPPGVAFEPLDVALKAHKDELYRIANSMALGVENNAAAVGRSAESKSEDSQSTKTTLIGFARAVKETMARVLTMVSNARGDDYDWQVDGLDDFAADDLAGLTTILKDVEAVGGIPSKTFQVECKKRLALAILPDLDETQKQNIAKEIEDGVEEQTAQAREDRELKRLTAIGGEISKARKEIGIKPKPDQKIPPKDDDE